MLRLKKIDETVIVDQCCSGKIYRYLKARIENVKKINNGMCDDKIVDIAEKIGAYLVTADKGFKGYPYENILVLPNGNYQYPKSTYFDLLKIIVGKEGNTKNGSGRKNSYERNNNGRNKRHDRNNNNRKNRKRHR